MPESSETATAAVSLRTPSQLSPSDGIQELGFRSQEAEVGARGVAIENPKSKIQNDPMAGWFALG